jgi:hypothetical protein
MPRRAQVSVHREGLGLLIVLLARGACCAFFMALALKRRWAHRLRRRVPDLATAFMTVVLSADPAANLPPLRAVPSPWTVGDVAARALDRTDPPHLAIVLDLGRGRARSGR